MTDFEVVWTEVAFSMLEAIRDKRIQRSLFKKALSLRQEPLRKGKPLQGKLAGYLSVRAVGQRYRIIYQVHEQCVRVLVVAVGIRKQGDPRDIYEKALKNTKHVN